MNYQIVSVKDIPIRFASMYRSAIEELKQAGRGKALMVTDEDGRARDGLRYAAKALGLTVRIQRRNRTELYCTIV